MAGHPLDSLSDLSHTTREHLRRNGITTLDQIVTLTPDDLMRVKGIKTRAAAIHAAARAYVENQPIRYAPMHPICRCEGVMFDLETDPRSGVPWSWGWIDSAGTPHTLIVASPESGAPLTNSVDLPDGRTIHLASGSDSAWRMFAEFLSASDCPIYHWTKFDQGVLRATAPKDVVSELDGRMHDLYTSFKNYARLPIRSYSLKVVAAYLFQNPQYGSNGSGSRTNANYNPTIKLWQEYDSWWMAWEDYRAWLKEGDTAILSRACNYQQADVEGLAVVWKWMNERD